MVASARWLARVLMLGAALAGAACDDGGRSGQAPAHPWIRPPEPPDPEAVTLSPYLIHRVAPAALAEAVAALADEPYIQLSPGMASHYTGRELRVPVEMRPFLVRGLDAGGSEIVVLQSALGLWVRAIGADGGAVRPQPLVIMSDPTPVEIHVTVEPAGAAGAAPDGFSRGD
jgi:hypothetical protein